MILLYSVNTNNYEKRISNHNLNDDISSILITGNKSDRFYKMNPQYLFHSIITVYCDANMTLLYPDKLISLCNMLSNSNKSAIFFKHPDRTTAKEEIEECIKRGLLSHDVLNRYDKWKKEGFDDKIQLMENNVLIRKTHDLDLQYCQDIWYNEYQQGMKRDQPSLLYSMWKTNYNNFILLEQKVKEEIFRWRPHGS